MKRKELRLKNYNYSSAGYYFVTVCTYHRVPLLGEVGAGASAGPCIVLSEIGQIVESAWRQIPEYYKGINIDTFVIMPNHMHGILILDPNNGRAQGPAPTMALYDVIHRFKSLTTHRYQKYESPSLPDKLWQRSYHERVIRNDTELNWIRQYILDNPANWNEDPENPCSSQFQNHFQHTQAIF